MAKGGDTSRGKRPLVPKSAPVKLAEGKRPVLPKAADKGGDSGKTGQQPKG